MHWMILPFRRYFEFSGRSRRMEYWMFTLFYLLVTLVLITPLIVDFISIIGTPDFDSSPGQVDDISALSWTAGGLWVLFVLGAFIPGLALSVRRFHDVGMSGWVFAGIYVASILIGIVGLAILVIALLPSNEGTNKWGPNPKNPHSADVFE